MMRKNIFTLIFSVLLVGALALPVLAVDCNDDGTWPTTACDAIPDTTGGGAGVTNLQFSPNVLFTYVADTVGTGTKYMMGTFNSKGTKTYGADSDYSGLYQSKADDATAAVDLPTGQSDVWASATWAEVAK